MGRSLSRRLRNVSRLEILQLRRLCGLIAGGSAWLWRRIVGQIALRTWLDPVLGRTQSLS